MQQRTRIGAIIQTKCPRCRQGDLFQYSLINYRKFHKMHEHCPECRLRYEVEPGFFFGAMYVSYAFIVGIVVVTSLALYFILDNPSVWVYLGAVYAVILLTLPLIFRYSRVLYLYWFGGVAYEGFVKQE